MKPACFQGGRTSAPEAICLRVVRGDLTGLMGDTETLEEGEIGLGIGEDLLIPVTALGFAGI